MTRQEVLQEIFDYVIEHLAKQGKRCLNEAGDCQYRKGGFKCAVGCLIPDDMYYESIEGLASNDLFKESLGKYSDEWFHSCLAISLDIDLEYIVEHSDFIALLLWDLQEAHDSKKTANDLHNALFNISSKYKISNIHVLDIHNWSY